MTYNIMKYNLIYLNEISDVYIACDGQVHNDMNSLHDGTFNQ